MTAPNKADLMEREITGNCLLTISEISARDDIGVSLKSEWPTHFSRLVPHREHVGPHQSLRMDCPTARSEGISQRKVPIHYSIPGVGGIRQTSRHTFSQRRSFIRSRRAQ